MKYRLSVWDYRREPTIRGIFTMSNNVGHCPRLKRISKVTEAPLKSDNQYLTGVNNQRNPIENIG